MNVVVFVHIFIIHNGIAIYCSTWKVFLVDCLLCKKNKYVEDKLNRTCSSTFIHTKTPFVTIQGTITAMKYRNNDIRSILFLHFRANLGMMLAQDDASCQADRSTLVMYVANIVHKLRWPAKSLYLNPIDHLLDLLKRKGSCTIQSLQLNHRELPRVIHQICVAIP